MKETLEKLWGEYFAEECALVEGDEERVLMRHAAELAEALSASMTKEQREATEKYVEAIYEIQGLFVKKVFFKGCEFTASFFLEAGGFPNG